MATMLNPNAIPDGSITKEKIESSVLAGKQDTLIAGDNITIVGNVISSTGGGGGGGIYPSEMNSDFNDDFAN